MRKPNFVEDKRYGTGPPKTATGKVADVFDNRSDRDWLNPNAMVILQEAVKNRRKKVTLNEVNYSLEYGVFFKSKVLESRESVKITRTDGFFAPFGYVTVKRILDFDYEAVQEDTKRKGKRK
jgi:hypothetical protein